MPCRPTSEAAVALEKQAASMRRPDHRPRHGQSGPQLSKDFAGFAPDSHPLCIGSMEATKRQKEYLQLQTGQESLLPPSYANFKMKSKVYAKYTN